jgi:hypothetical protein
VATLEFYLSRAAECSRDADKAVLANVRDRQLVARDAWLAMAERLERTTESRRETAAAKAELAMASSAEDSAFAFDEDPDLDEY